jgi:ATP-dependent Clp protease ATP-binding subunit ClpA
MRLLDTLATRKQVVLTESVRRRPYQILLLDEFEKAHCDVRRFLMKDALQIRMAEK